MEYNYTLTLLNIFNSSNPWKIVDYCCYTLRQHHSCSRFYLTYPYYKLVDEMACLSDIEKDDKKDKVN